MATLLMGHGGVIDGEEVVVPEGWTISYLTDEGNSLPFFNGVGYMLDQQSLIAGGFSPYGPDSGGDRINNRVIQVLSSTQRAWYAQVDPEDGSCFYAGEHFDSDLKLCMDPAQCEQNPGGAHTCGGIFSIGWPDTNLVWVSCQYTPAGITEMEMGSTHETAYRDFAADAYDKLQNLSDEDFASWYDSLTPEQVAQIQTYKAIRQWTVQREGRRFLAANGDEQFYALVESRSTDDPNATEEDRAYYLADTDLADAHGRGQFIRQAREYLADNGQEAYLTWFRTLDQGWRDVLTAIPELAEAPAATGETNVAAEPAWVPVQENLDTAAGVNRAATKDLDDGESAAFTVGGFLLLIGDGHDQAYVDYVDGQADKAAGQVTVRKGRLGRGAGSLTFTGVPPAKQGVVQSAVEAFSDKDVVFA